MNPPYKWIDRTDFQPSEWQTVFVQKAEDPTAEWYSSERFLVGVRGHFHDKKFFLDNGEILTWPQVLGWRPCEGRGFLTFRPAIIEDARLYFEWTNDPEVRKQSHNTNPVLWDDHLKWFTRKINSEAIMLLFFASATPVGQIRIEPEEGEGLISMSVASNHRVKGTASEMLRIARDFVNKFQKVKYLTGEVKKDNIPSIRAFEKAAYNLEKEIEVKGVPCNLYRS